MPETVKLNLYDVVKCGYYEDGSDVRSFSSLEEILIDLNNWIGDLSLQETKTYERNQYQNKLPTYSFDLVSDRATGDYLLTTWNETPSDQGNFASVNLRSNVGQYDVDIVEIDEDHAPGYATYFWFLPEHDKFCTVRFNNPLNGHPNLKLYLKNYLRYFSGWVIDEYQDGEREILGFGHSRDNYDANLNPVFESRPSVRTGDRQYLTRNADRIRKVLRKNRITYQNNRNLNFMTNVFNRLGIDNDLVPEVDFHDVRFEIDREFTAEEAGNVYDYWVENLSDEDNQVEDIGFRFVGNQNDYWLSRIIKKQEFEIEVVRRNEEVVDAEHLLRELIDNTREEMITLI